MTDQATVRYIDLTSDESAALDDVDAILPITVYQELAGFIESALDKVKDLKDSDPIEMIQRHGAITIDGDRGTGKTSVLVNLGRYLEKKHSNRDLHRDVHVLKPIDPTLLEDGETLFTHVIIASILCDDAIRHAQRSNQAKAMELSRALQDLSNALESLESHKDTSRGIDRLRSVADSRTLSEKIHLFFQKALRLLDKKLLVIPIDDVDTSLNRAFENLEVVRRYLVSPLVLPIISGSLKLYHQVVWRDFHGRLMKDSKYHEQEAYDIAQDLATEYQRKILPVPLRIQMPPVSDYMRDEGIILIDKSKNRKKLIEFIDMMNNNVYGIKSSFDNFKIRETVENEVKSARSLMQILREFHYSEKEDINRLIIKNFESIPDIVRSICKSNIHWSEIKSGKYNDKRIFNTDIFNYEINSKLSNDMKNIEYIENSKLQELSKEEEQDIKDVILHNTIEIGLKISFDRIKNTIDAYKTKSYDDIYFIMKMCHENTFIYKSSRGKFINKISFGRVFELIVLSFIRDIRPRDIQIILADKPYNSYSYYLEKNDNKYKSISNNNAHIKETKENNLFIIEISTKINEWRNINKEALEIHKSSWFFKKLHDHFRLMMNYNAYIGYTNEEGAIKYIMKNIFSMWSTIGMLEISYILGDSAVPLNELYISDEEFESSDHYKSNIKPIKDAMNENNKLKSITESFEHHPIYKIIHSLHAIRNTVVLNKI